MELGRDSGIIKSGSCDHIANLCRIGDIEDGHERFNEMKHVDAIRRFNKRRRVIINNAWTWEITDHFLVKQFIHDA